VRFAGARARPLKGLLLLRILVENHRARVQDCPPEIFKLLRYELSYQVSEPGYRCYLDGEGRPYEVWWDGFTCLLRKDGWMPAGLLRRSLRLLQKWGVEVEVEDQRICPPERDPLWQWPSSFQLRDYQIRAADAAWSAGRGVIDSPPRTGKTVVMLELLRRVSRRAVVTSPTIHIAEQSMQKAIDFFGSAADFYLLVGGAPDSRRARMRAGAATVFFATADTAATMGEDWWRKIECLIVDERHHQAAKTYHTINDLAKTAYYRWGFTGTNFRSDAREELALEACLSEVVASYSIADMQAAGVLVAGHVEFRVAASKRLGERALFPSAYRRGIVRDVARNKAVAEAARELMAQGRRVLILVRHIAHGQLLAALIPGSRFVESASGKAVRQVVAQLDSGEIRCVIGSPVVGEGLDIPSADALIYAKGEKARVAHTQDLFRVLTAAPGKRDAVIIDFADRHQPKLLEHSVERLRNYLATRCRVKVVDVLAPNAVNGA